MEWGGFDLHPKLAGSESVPNNTYLQVGSSLGIDMMCAMFQGFSRGTYFGDLTEAGLNSEQIDYAKMREIFNLPLFNPDGSFRENDGATKPKK